MNKVSYWLTLVFFFLLKRGAGQRGGGVLLAVAQTSSNPWTTGALPVGLITPQLVFCQLSCVHHHALLGVLWQFDLAGILLYTSWVHQASVNFCSVTIALFHILAWTLEIGIKHRASNILLMIYHCPNSIHIHRFSRDSSANVLLYSHQSSQTPFLWRVKNPSCEELRFMSLVSHHTSPREALKLY